MAYRFENDESVRDGFVRCAAEQLDKACTELSARIGDDPVDAVHSAALIALIDHRRDELQTEALWVAARVYAEKPKAFVARVGAAWESGRGYAAAALGPAATGS